MDYHVYFRRPDDCVVYTPVTEHHEISLLHRMTGGWHCALCDATDCRHAEAAARAAEQQAGDSRAADAAGSVFTVPRPDG